MAWRALQLAVSKDSRKVVERCLSDLETTDYWTTDVDDGDRVLVQILVRPGQGPELMDALQDALEGHDGWRLALLPVEALAPESLNDEEEEQVRSARMTYAREEILNTVQQNGQLTRYYLLMCALSTIVAAIGLGLDNLAVVIGAMVISPLLGPLLAFSFAVALGARGMMLHTALASLAGFATSIAGAAAMALALPLELTSGLLDYSEPIRLEALALPLAAGAAAALAAASNTSSAFVGVTVAAALLPPLAASALLGGAGEWQYFRADAGEQPGGRPPGRGGG